jgi:fibronectin-binding autotransporter adhesin
MKIERKILRSFVLGALFSLALAGLLCPSAFAIDYSWNVAGPLDWNTAENWSPTGIPGADDNAFIDNAGIATLSAAGTAYDVVIGSGEESNSGELDIQPGATLDVTDWLTVGMGGTTSGTVIQTGGTVNLAYGATLAAYGTSTATYTISGTSVLNVNTVGDGSYFVVGNNADITAVMNIQDEAQVTFNNRSTMWLGYGYDTTLGGYGTVNQTGGTVHITGSNVKEAYFCILGIGVNGGGNGVYNLGGGDSSANLILDSNSNGVTLGWYDGATGVFYLNENGTLTTPTVHMGSPWGAGTGTFYFNGGTLKANANNGAFMTGGNSSMGTWVDLNIYVSDGGAIIDTNGYNVAIGTDIYHDDAGAATDGGLIKKGAGTLNLTGTLYYTGTTEVVAGTLALNGYLFGTGGDLKVDSGSTFVLNGYAAIVRANPGQLYAYNVTVDDATIPFDLSSSAAGDNDHITASNDLTLTGTTDIPVNLYQGRVEGGSTPANYVLFECYNTLTGGAANLNLTGIPANTRQTFTLGSDATSVYITVAGNDPLDLTWDGTVDDNWDVNVTANWTGSDTYFWNLDNVTFDDTNSSSPTDVKVAGTVYPGKVTVNSSRNYTFSPKLVGNIAASSLEKDGTGTLTISTSDNNFPMGVTVQGGSLVLNGGNNTLGPAGPISVSNGATLDMQGNDQEAMSLSVSNAGLLGTGTFTATDGDITFTDITTPTITANLVSSVGGIVITSGDVKMDGNTVDMVYVDLQQGSLNIDPASFSASDGMWVGTTGVTVSLNVEDSTVQTGYISLAEVAGSVAVVNLTNSTVSSDGTLLVGNNGNAYLHQNGGAVSAGGWLNIANVAGVGSYEVNNGTITAGAALCVGTGGGANSTGLLVIKGEDSVVDVSASGSILAVNPWCQSGTITQYAGAVYLSSTKVAGDWSNVLQVGGDSGGTGVYNQLGGSVTAPGNGVGLMWYNGWNPGDNVGTYGIYNLNGGELATSCIYSGSIWSGTEIIHAYLNFHGGTLKPTEDNDNFIYNAAPTASGNPTREPDPNGLSAAYVWSEGAVIDTDGHNITINTALEAPPGQGVASIDVTNGGSGYKGTPVIKIVSTDGGICATAIAEMVDDGTGNGTYSIGSITITNPGTDYIADVTPIAVTIVGGDPDTAATIGDVTLADNASGGLTKQGLGTLTLTGALTYTGDTTVEAGTLDVTVLNSSADTLVKADATLTADYIEQNSLTVDAGGKVIIKPLAGGASVAGLTAVPEPSTITLLVLAGLGLLFAARRKK